MILLRRSMLLGGLLLALGGALDCDADSGRISASRERIVTNAAAGGAGRSIQLESCAVGRSNEPALCGAHEVFEDREARTGRKISLNIVVLPAARPGPRRAGR